MCRLPSIKPSMDELDKVTELANRLQRMSTWNFWAAGLMGVTALLSVWARFLGCANSQKFFLIFDLRDRAG
jgi:hypothetical protein